MLMAVCGMEPPSPTSVCLTDLLLLAWTKFPDGAEAKHEPSCTAVLGTAHVEI